MSLEESVQWGPVTRAAPIERTRFTQPGSPAGSGRSQPSVGTVVVGDLVLRTEEVLSDVLLEVWQQALARSNSPERIYQSPAFFRFLKDCPDGDRAVLLSVSRRADPAVVGLIPLRVGGERLHVGVGPLAAISPLLTVVRLLGSIPMVEEVDAGQLIDAILTLFPEADAVSMQALPQESAWWNSLAQSTRLRRYVYNDWRDCHTIPLGGSFEQYLAQFSSKKRYNLNRQIRQLEEKAGAITVDRVVAREQVADMVAAARQLATVEQRNGLLPQREYEALAHQGLLLSHVIRCAGQPCGVVIGSFAAGVWHVYKILWDSQYAALSIGTSVLHLGMRDAIEAVGPERVDLGYGAPNREFASSHVLFKRAHVLAYRRSLRASLACALHACAIGVLVPLRKLAKRTQRAASRAKG